MPLASRPATGWVGLGTNREGRKGILASNWHHTGRDGTNMGLQLGRGMHLCIRALRLCICGGVRASLARKDGDGQGGRVKPGWVEPAHTDVGACACAYIIYMYVCCWLCMCMTYLILKIVTTYINRRHWRFEPCVSNDLVWLPLP